MLKCRKFLCFNLLKSLLAVISLLLLMAKWCTVPPLSTPSRVRGNRVQLLYNRTKLCRVCAVLCTVGKGTYKMPWGHFMLYGVYAWRRFANLHQTPFDTNLSKYFFHHAMGNTKEAKCSEMLHVVASNTPKKCLKNIVMMLTLLTFSHSMTNTKHQHQIHHLHR